jgi:hypothetical protein
MKDKVHAWNDSKCDITLLESHRIVFHNFLFVTINLLKTCICVCWKTSLEIHFIYLGKKEVYWIFKTCCIISVLFSTECCFFIILSLSVQITLFHKPCAKILIRLTTMLFPLVQSLELSSATCKCWICGLQGLVILLYYGGLQFLLCLQIKLNKRSLSGSAGSTPFI